MGRHANQDRITGSANINDSERKVYIGYRPIGGPGVGLIHTFTGGPVTWLEKTGKWPPNPRYHWCVIVGSWYHQLQATNLNGGDNYYDNQKTSSWDLWNTYEVGKTKFNDKAIAEAGIKAIAGMPQAYNLKNNNCQTFVIKVLNMICRAGRKKVKIFNANGLHFANVIGFDLVGIVPSEGEEVEVPYVANGVAHVEHMLSVEELMDEHTPALTEEEVQSGNFHEPPNVTGLQGTLPQAGQSD
jgi:hypothetical protein